MLRLYRCKTLIHLISFAIEKKAKSGPFYFQTKLFFDAQINIILFVFVSVFDLFIDFFFKCFIDIREILKNGGTVLNAEGYMWEFGRRGYLKYGGYIPEVVLEHPDLVEVMHNEFVHAGSDVVQAFTVNEFLE